jgi:hypothetical protein
MRDTIDLAITAIEQALAALPTHKTARWTDEEYREISDQVISTLVEYGAELRTADCQMQILREELAESRREIDALVALARADAIADEREQGQKWFDAVTAQHKQLILAEREACAKAVEQTKWSNWFQADAAAAIRARGNT